MSKKTKLYRYQKFSAQSFQLLCHDELYFSDAQAFNDPLDCQPHVEVGTDIREMRSILRRLVSDRVQREAESSLKKIQLKDKNALDYAEKLGQQAADNKLNEIAYHANDPEYEISVKEAECWLLTCEIQAELLKRYDKGICCFSASYNDPLLWSHYADQHKGFHAGYCLDRNPEPVVHKIEYGGNRTIPMALIAEAILNETKESLSNLDHSVLLRKAPSWKYEKEWRLIDRKGVRESPLLLSEITFGLRCPAAIRYAVISALKARGDDIAFYEMHQKRGSFQLARELVDCDEILASFPEVARSGIEVFGHLPPIYIPGDKI